MTCPICRTDNPDTSKFCQECGAKLREAGLSSGQNSIVEEKKQATIFFADLSGFTAMSERLDSEEVKDIMQRILSTSAAIVNRYGGRVDKFIGDCVMAVFGIPQAHEDDAVQAIHAAIEIHAAVDALNTPELKTKIGRNLSMHTGVNTGIVVSGDLDIEKGMDKILGDTVNVASRLSGVAEQGEIVVGRDTFSLADWHFEFEALPPVSVKGKGKAEALTPYKIIGHKKAADNVRRLKGRKSRFIGRERELAGLIEASEALGSKKGTAVSISGEAGSGKSRLVSEFKSKVSALGDRVWKEAFAYPYSEGIAYSVWIDFINRLLSIDEGDSKEQVRQKLEGIGTYCGDGSVTPFIGALYSIVYPETKSIDPGSLKVNIANSIISLVRGIAQSGNAIFVFDDLHWADPSSLEILYKFFQGLDIPALFLCVHRPGITIGPEQVPVSGSLAFRAISIPPLGSANEEQMIASLLDSEKAPPELLRYIMKKISGTPFYIEEIINNLIETKVLFFDGGNWKLTRDLTESEIPLSIQGVISARIDRLEPIVKRILQTASVIGQTFFYSLLKRVTELSSELDDSLALLESIDVIREGNRELDIEYLFKHALLRDVVYNSILKKERGTIHESIANLMENVFKERIEEFYETLAFHYQKSGNEEKAVAYLINAGRKSMASYASSEANNFYKQAYTILTGKTVRTIEETSILIRLLNDWGFTHYYLGTFRDWADLFKKHIGDAEAISETGARALFYAELGYALNYVMETDLSMTYQYKALRLAEEGADQRALAYAHCWLADQSFLRGRLTEGIEHGDKGMVLAQEVPAEPYLFVKSGFGKALCLAARGNIAQARKVAQIILEFGEKLKNPTCISLANGAFEYIEFYSGNCNKVVNHFGGSGSIQPLYSHYSKPTVAFCLMMIGRYDEAENLLKNSEEYFKNTHVQILGQLLLIGMYRAFALIAKDHKYAEGISAFRKIVSAYKQTNWFSFVVSSNFLLGSVYLRMLISGSAIFSYG